MQATAEDRQRKASVERYPGLAPPYAGGRGGQGRGMLSTLQLLHISRVLPRSPAECGAPPPFHPPFSLFHTRRGGLFYGAFFFFSKFLFPFQLTFRQHVTSSLPSLRSLWWGSAVLAAGLPERAPLPHPQVRKRCLGSWRARLRFPAAFTPAPWWRGSPGMMRKPPADSGKEATSRDVVQSLELAADGLLPAFARGSVLRGSPGRPSCAQRRLTHI